MSDAPNPFMLNRGIAVDQDVSKRDDLANIGNAGREVWSLLGDLTEGLPNDLELRSTAEWTTSEPE